MNELTVLPSPGTLMNQATDVAGVCKEIVLRTAMTIQGRKYVKVEGWQSIAAAYGCVASSKNVQKVDGGVRATGELHRIADGALIASAEGFVGEDEPTWYGGANNYGKILPKRPDYAIQAMAQTRAISRVCRSAFAFVVVMIDGNLSTTPAEEMTFDNEPSAPVEKKPVMLTAPQLKKALQEFADKGLDEQKILAHIGHDKPWTREEMNAAWDALVDAV